MEKNKKNVIIIATVCAIALGVYFIGGVTKQHKKTPRNIGGVNMEKIFSKIEGVPTGAPDVVGRFVAMDGEQIIVERVVGEMVTEDRKKTQASMQTLSDGGRQQMREVRRAERELAEKEKVFVTINDATSIMKIDESGTAQKISIEEIGENKNVMIWKDDSSAVFILQNNMERGNNS